MNDLSSAAASARYLAKLLAGLLSMTVVVAVTAQPSLVHQLARGMGIGAHLAFTGLALLLCGVTPVMWLAYRGMDELNRSLHQQASAITYPVCAVSCGIVGLLQANDLLPLFNLLWVVGAQVAGWGVALMLCDRRLR